MLYVRSLYDSTPIMFKFKINYDICRCSWQQCIQLKFAKLHQMKTFASHSNQTWQDRCSVCSVTTGKTEKNIVCVLHHRTDKQNAI